jgi:hypothetical protein
MSLSGCAYAASPRYAIQSAHNVARTVLNHISRDTEVFRHTQKRLADLLRDVIGNPFRPPAALDPAWLSWNGGLAVRLARSIYDERDFARLPVLGDALEEAGCTAQDVLAHCRSPGEHARGCWAVDWVLGRT